MALFTSRFSAKRMMLFCRSLAVTYDSGIPLVRGLALLVREGKGPKQRHILARLKEDVERGASFHEALSNQSAYFPSLFLGVVAAGEAGGSLSSMFTLLADHYEDELRIRRAIIRQVVYPLCVVIVAVVVIPFVRGLASTSKEVEEYVVDYVLGWSGTALRVVVAWAVISVLARLGILKRIWDPLVLYLWPLSTLKRKFLVARFLTCMGLMQRSGLSVPSSIERAAAAMDNTFLQRQLMTTVAPIRRGMTVSEAFEGVRALPLAAKQMIMVGEQTGKLDSVLLRTGKQLHDEAIHTLHVIIPLLEVALILLIGYGIATGFLIR